MRHIALADELFGAADIEYGAAVDLELTLKAMRAGKLALHGAGDDIHRRPLVAMIRCMPMARASWARRAIGISFLCLPSWSGRRTHRSPEQWMAGTGVPFRGLSLRAKFLIIFFDIPAAGFFQQVVPVIHFNAQRVQCMDHLLGIGDDRPLHWATWPENASRSCGKYSIPLFLGSTSTNFNCEGCFEYSSDTRIAFNRLYLACCTGLWAVWYGCQVYNEILVIDLRFQWQLVRNIYCSGIWSEDNNVFMLTSVLRAFGTSIPIVPLPGMGAMMRMPRAAGLSAISSSRFLIRDMHTRCRDDLIQCDRWDQRWRWYALNLDIVILEGIDDLVLIVSSSCRILYDLSPPWFPAGRANIYSHAGREWGRMVWCLDRFRRFHFFGILFNGLDLQFEAKYPVQ